MDHLRRHLVRPGGGRRDDRRLTTRSARCPTTPILEELPVAANDGLQLVKIDGIVVKRDGQTVDLGTIDDRNETEAYIHTTAHDQLDGDKIVDADEDAKSPTMSSTPA